MAKNKNTKSTFDKARAKADNVFKNLMQGRYGFDNYSMFLLATGIILMILGIITNNVPGTILMMFATWEMIYAYIRSMSKKFDLRKEQNKRYLYQRNSFLGTFKIIWRTIKEGKNYKFFKCPDCAVVLRLPKKQGAIQITCPKCGRKFIKKT